MTQIIDFQTFRGARPPRDAMPPGNAEILFFLGVRYERMPDAMLDAPAPVKSPARTAKRSRKRRA